MHFVTPKKRCIRLLLVVFDPHHRRPCFSWIGPLLSHCCQTLGSNGPAHAASLGGVTAGEKVRERERERKRGRERERERVARIARILDAHLWTRAGGEPRALFARKIRLKQRNQYQHLRGGKRGGEGGVPGSLSRHIQWEIRCEAVFSALFYWCEPARPFYGLSLFAGDRVAENKYVPAGGV